jgi:hypothetical protein
VFDDVAELVVDLAGDRLVDRDDGRTTVRWVSLFLGVVGLLLAIGVAASSGPWYGLAVGVVGLALVVYGA